MTTLMRNGLDRRSGKPVKCHARKERALLVGIRSATHIRASGQRGCTQRPDTWLHPKRFAQTSDSSCIAGAVHTWHFASDEQYVSDVRNLGTSGLSSEARSTRMAQW